MQSTSASDFTTEKLARYGAFNTHDALKILALLFMAVDHTGWFAYPDEMWLRAIGRGAAPMFFFFIGYARSYRIRLSLVLCALLLAAVNTPLSGSLENINILVSFIIARLLLKPLEEGKIPVTKPWDYFALLAVLFPSVIAFHYGTPGLLFSYCGWLQRHPERFARHDRRNIMIASFIFYGGLEARLFGFSWADAALMTVTLAVTMALLWHYRPQPLALPGWAAPAGKPLAWVARYSLWIYTFHLAALQLITGKFY